MSTLLNVFAHLPESRPILWNFCWNLHNFIYTNLRLKWIFKVDISQAVPIKVTKVNV